MSFLDDCWEVAVFLVLSFSLLPVSADLFLFLRAKWFSVSSDYRNACVCMREVYVFLS
ncbi:uncharacterized protein BO66DRAFT_394289 [Aspergillus aculeatinus CBS 121060]|uniref:Uncharacterized protein n=1 Tax=Aspergillus aculeatinus CBS 121060 TaxID=1448322 RepID=A0ACD1GZL9_9EURO|nr:hypothetical protein BO66DRAFT_394289 [Aspergillus aculeatinus CBS 121060]RAH66778.1 hypothetical protein BO66DRAFT_394289 [Aspergillus aculeatinus CBS 121060]